MSTQYFKQTNETFEDDYYANECFSKDSLKGLDYLLMVMSIDNAIKAATKPYMDVMDSIIEGVEKIKTRFKD